MMNKINYLYGIINNEVVQFEVMKELDNSYSCFYCFKGEYGHKGIMKDMIHKDYFLNYKRCEQVLKKRLKESENNEE